MSDGLNMQPRPGEPERNAPAPPNGASVRFVVNPRGIPDTSISGPVMLQQPSRWTHDFDPDTGESRAHLPAVVPIFANPPSAVTPPAGSSDSTLATTEFVSNAMREAVEEAVLKARIGVVDGFPARPGEIGEHLQITIPQPGVELQSTVVVVSFSMPLSPGDWDVQAMAGFATSGLNPTNCDFVAALAQDQTTFPGWPNFGGTMAMQTVPGSIGNVNLPVFQRVLISQPITMFMLVYARFEPPVRINSYGYMSARRRR